MPSVLAQKVVAEREEVLRTMLVLLVEPLEEVIDIAARPLGATAQLGSTGRKNALFRVRQNCQPPMRKMGRRRRVIARRLSRGGERERVGPQRHRGRAP